jgi:hypothetical protein
MVSSSPWQQPSTAICGGAAAHARAQRATLFSHVARQRRMWRAAATVLGAQRGVRARLHDAGVRARWRDATTAVSRRHGAHNCTANANETALAPGTQRCCAHSAGVSSSDTRCSAGGLAGRVGGRRVERGLTAQQASPSRVLTSATTFPNPTRRSSLRGAGCGAGSAAHGAAHACRAEAAAFRDARRVGRRPPGRRWQSKGDRLLVLCKQPTCCSQRSQAGAR